MNNAKITVHPGYRIAPIEKQLYGCFLEPIGNWVYGHVYDPEHPTADEKGFRSDILREIRELGIPAVRLPGGNFTSGWDWKDSIGPVEQRKVHMEPAWFQYENNIIGHDEYLDWAKRAGMEPLYTLNMGTADINSAAQCLEYTNHPGGTYWSDLRRKNGYDRPHQVKTWYLGNEMDGPWQIRSWEKDPKSYGVAALEYSKLMKWMDPSIRTVVCGGSSPHNHTHPVWDREVLEECYEVVDMVSIHHYHTVPQGNIAELMAASVKIEEFIQAELAVCDYVAAKYRDPRKMMISFDEYGFNFFEGTPKVPHARAGNLPADTWYGYFPPTMPEYKVLDLKQIRYHKLPEKEILYAIASASTLLTFLRHADRIKVACMTLAIGGALAYDKDHVWPLATYYPLLHLIRYGKGISLLPAVESPTYNTEGYSLTAHQQCAPHENVPFIEAAAAWDQETEDLNVFVINRNWEARIPVELDIRGFKGYEFLEHVVLFTDNPDEYNSFEHRGIVPSAGNAVPDGGKLSFAAEKLSWNVLRFHKK